MGCCLWSRKESDMTERLGIAHVQVSQVVKNLLADAGDAVSIPALGRSPGEGNGYPLQYSCLENPLDRGA